MNLVHRVWLGSEPPAKHDFSAHWQATNPGYELVTWTDGAVDDDLEHMVCQVQYDDAPTYVHRADIVLVEAVYRYGGVAVGYDMEPLQPIDPLIAGHDAWCTPDADGFPGQAFFGGIPGHRAFAAVLDRLPQRLAERGGWMQHEEGQFPGPHLDTGPWLWGDVFGRHGEQAAAFDLDILGTWETAYPVRYFEKDRRIAPRELRRRMDLAYVHHLFAGSWVSDPSSVLVRR